MMMVFEKKTSKKKQDVIEEAIAFVSEYYDIDGINIYIEPRRSLLKTLNQAGNMIYEGDNDYAISIDITQSLKEIFITTLHEMVHVAQFFTGKLSYGENMGHMFDGKFYPKDVEYRQRPWEIEAHKMEDVLLNEFAKG